MGAIIVLTPLLIAGWPAITAAVTAAVGSLGFAVLQGAVPDQETATSATRTEIDVEDTEILEAGGATGEELVIERDGVRGVFARDARGALKLCLEGAGMTKTELQKLGEELIGRVTQQYAYHRIVSELKSRNMAIVEEEVSADRTVKIRVRSQ
jgi:hypothetical protein